MPSSSLPVPEVDPSAPPPVPPAFGEAAQPDPEPTTPEEAALLEEKNETFGRLDEWHSSVMANYVFNATITADPFMPIDSARAPTTAVAEDPNLKKPMIQKLSLSQFSLNAIIVAADPNDASAVVDSGGRGFIIKRGTMIGPNNGYVSEITDTKVGISEPEVNYQGETTFKETVFSLEQPDNEGLEAFEE
jgi:Tfp pilus assembly protein PilP